MYVPELRSNLLSVPVITEKKYKVKFSDNKAYISRPDKSLAFIAIRKDRMYIVRHMTSYKALNIYSNSELKIKLWHERYGHLNHNDLKELYKKKRVYGLDLLIKNQDLQCQTCDQAKIHVLPFTEGTRAKKNIKVSTYRYLRTHRRKIK